ncbi:MAG: ATP-dependent RecD-like DNA helicase [Clostridia bacterium]|nr:ATP-dependent RecD-like DNA helicase [Clostridia bacterium]
MQIEGEIESIIFNNESNGYTVARLLHNNENTVIVGKFFKIACGEKVRLNGEFVTNQKFGEQFAFETFEIVYPTTVNGIKKFLGSGLIKGVGPVTAQNIVAKFGEDSLNVIEFQPDSLAKVSGISAKKAKVINEYFYNYKNVQNIIIFLSEYNISTNLALKIYTVYKAETIKKIQENPYALVEDIDGVGFITADNIANKFGISKDSEFRVRAGILYSLSQASEKNGHTFLPYDDLIRSLSKLLNLNQEKYENLFETVLQTLVLEKVVKNFFINKINIVMLSKFYFYEKSVADKLSLINISQTATEIDIAEDIKHFEEVNHINFHNEQINAIKTAINNGVCVITGGPGTGKTTIIKCILSILEAQGICTALLAPTGRASKRMSDATDKEASTIHRALAMDFATKRFAFNEKNFLPFDAIIVDEFSMVDVMLANHLLKALSRDCKIIMVGDKNQLPSVGAGNVLDDIIKSQTIKVANLTQIFRQEENSLIISNAHLINSGEMPEFDNKSNDFFFETKENLYDIKENIVNLITNRLPNFLNIPPSQIQVLAPLKNGVCGVETINKELQQKLNPPAFSKPEIVFGANIFRKGDKIMQTANNYNLEWVQQLSHNRVAEGVGIFNGDMGYISEIDRDTGEIYVNFEGNKQCVYPRTEISQLSLAYAITIHKSQGSEFDVVVIPSIAGPSMILNRNLIYTAVTRAKKMVVLVGEKRHLKTMINNKFILKRHTLLKEFLIKSNENAKILFE